MLKRHLINWGAVLLLTTGLTAQESLRYPPGTSDHTLEGLAVTLDVPRDLSQENRASLIILLHGYGGKGKRLMTLLRDWVADGYIVCAPQATQAGWTPRDVAAAARIGSHLLQTMPIGKDRVHVVGFSNGGWVLPELACHEGLKPVSAVYVGAGYRGPKPPRWARKRQGVLAVAGAEDPNAAQTRDVPRVVGGKVRLVEARFQPNLGHKWPRDLNPYMRWWMGVQEGRFEPGETLAFAWAESLEKALESQKGRKKGGVLVYVFDSKADAQNEAAKKLQNETMLDARVRFYTSQIAAAKLDRLKDTIPFEGIKATPSLVLLKRDGTVKKILPAKTSAKKLLAAMKSLVPRKTLPKNLR